MKVCEEDCVSCSEDVEALWLVAFPLAVHVLSVGEVEEGGALEFVVVPVGGGEEEVVIDEYAGSMALAMEVDGALIFAVTVVYYFHFSDIRLIVVGVLIGI